MSNVHETFRTPVRKKKIVVVAFTIVGVIVIGLVYLMAKGPGDETLATELVNETLAILPPSFSSGDLRHAGRKLAEARELAPHLTNVQNAYSELQQRVENQIYQRISESQLDDLDSMLLEAAHIWPMESQFQESGIFHARLEEKRKELELRERLQSMISEMIVRLETNSDQVQSLNLAIQLIEDLLGQSAANPNALLPQDSLDTLLRRTSDVALELEDADNARRVLDVLDSSLLNEAEYGRLKEILNQKITQVEVKLQIDELLAEAEEHITNDRLSTPEGRNALFNFQQVLELDPGNVSATNGIKRVEARYVALADQSLINNNLTGAQKFIDTLARVSPQHKSLPRLRNKLEIVRKDLAAQSNRNMNEEKQSEVAQDLTSAVQTEPVEEYLDDEESRLWRRVMNSCNQTDLRKYIDTYPSGRYVDDAWQRISDCLAEE